MFSPEFHWSISDQSDSFPQRSCENSRNPKIDFFFFEIIFIKRKISSEKNIGIDFFSVLLQSISHWLLLVKMDTCLALLYLFFMRLAKRDLAMKSVVFRSETSVEKTRWVLVVIIGINDEKRVANDRNHTRNENSN